MHFLLITLAMLASHPPPVADLSPAHEGHQYTNATQTIDDATNTGQNFNEPTQHDGTPSIFKGGDGIDNFCAILGDFIETSDAKATGNDPRWTDEPRDPGSSIGGPFAVGGLTSLNFYLEPPRWRDLQRRSST